MRYFSQNILQNRRKNSKIIIQFNIKDKIFIQANKILNTLHLFCDQHYKLKKTLLRFYKYIHWYKIGIEEDRAKN